MAALGLHEVDASEGHAHVMLHILICYITATIHLLYIKYVLKNVIPGKEV